MWDFRGIIEFIKDTSVYIIVFVCVIIFYMFIMSFQGIVGNSMAPNLNDNELVVIAKFTTKIFGPRRFDIVSLKSSDGKLYTKRVIGLPNEEIHYLNNTLYVNGYIFNEKFLVKGTHTNSFYIKDICSKDLCPDGKIPDGYYLVLGDNRTDSLDSRDPSLGLVPKNNIIGKVIFRIWPFGSINSK